MMKLITASLAGLVAGLSAAPAGSGEPQRGPLSAVVVDASGPGATARLAAARTDAARRGADLKVTHALHEQLSVTALLAAKGYGTIVGYGLEAPVAIAPLHGAVRYVDAG